MPKFDPRDPSDVLDKVLAVQPFVDVLDTAYRRLMPDSTKQVLANHRRVVMAYGIIGKVTANRLIADYNWKNRKITKNTVDRYRRDMNAGNWGLSDSAICFGWEDGKRFLQNGQHRLLAFIASDLDYLVIQVMLNMPVEAGSVMDSGKKRTLVDTINFSNKLDMKVSDCHLTAIRTYLDYSTGHDGANLSSDTLIDFIKNQYKEGCDFVFSRWDETRFHQGYYGAFLGVCLRAYYFDPASRDRLGRLIELVCDDVNNPSMSWESSDQAALAVRELILGLKARKGKGNFAGRQDVCLDFEAAIYGYVNGENGPVPQRQRYKRGTRPGGWYVWYPRFDNVEGSKFIARRQKVAKAA